MRRLIALFSAAALLGLFASTSSTAWAEDADPEGGTNGIGVTANSDGTVDASAGFKLPNKQNKGASDPEAKKWNTIGGKQAAAWKAQQEAARRRQQEVCSRLFTDVRTRQGLASEGSIALQNTYRLTCMQNTDANSGTLTAPNPPPNPYLLGAEAVTRLTIPAPAPLIGPDPSINKWNMAVVNLNYWLHVEGPTTLASSVTLQGHTVSLSATRRDVQFSMGDGTVKICTATTPWQKGTPPTVKSPTCGHLYTKKSKPHYYRLRAMATWDVTWSVLGQSGTIPVTTSDSRQLLVGELVSVIVPNR